MAPKAATLSSKLPEIMAQITQTLAESFEKMAEALFTRLQNQEKELIGEATKEVKEIKTEVAEVRKDLENVKNEVIKAQPKPKPSPEVKFDGLHDRNRNFVGRNAELGKLFGLWKPGRKGRIAVVGLGGVGKTALVTEFAYRIHEMSPATSVFWFGLDDLIEIHDKFSTRLNDFLGNDHAADCLLVLDTNDRFKELFGLSADLLITKLEEFEGSIVILARSIQDGSLLAGPHDLCELHGLEVDASITLLRKRLGSMPLAKATEDQLIQVVRSMASSPRALIQLSSFLNNSGMTISQLLDLYQKSEEISLRLFSRQEPRLKFAEDTSIICKGVFDVKSFRDAYPDPARFLFQLYFLGGTSVPPSIFVSTDDLDRTISMGVLKGHFVLARTDDNTLTLHPLVFLAIKKILDTEERKPDDPDVKQEKKWQENILIEFSKTYPGVDCKKRDSWWANWFPSMLSSYKVQTDSQRVAVAAIYDKESRFSLNEGVYPKALKLASKATETLPDPIPVQHLHVLENKLSILDLLSRYGDLRFELERYHHEKLPPRILLRKQRFQAKLYLAECVDGYESAARLLNDIRTSGLLNGADHWRSMTDYAVALMLKGRYKEAEGQSRDALAMKTKILGPDHRDTLIGAHVLAEVLMKAGKFDEALHHIQHAFHGREAVIGSQHPETLHSKMVFASLLFAKALTLGDYDESEKLLLDCSNGLSSLSDRHPLVLTSNSILALVLFAQGKYAASEKLNGTVLAARQNGPWLEPKTHPDTLTSMHQLMEIFRLGGRLSAADEMSKFILEERTRVLTRGAQAGEAFHPDQLSSFHHRAIVLSLRASLTTGTEATKLHAEAVQAIETALKWRTAILGPDHLDVFLSMTWKGEILRAEQRSQQLYPADRSAKLNLIDSLHSEALKRLTLICGPEHRNTLQCKLNLAAAKLERETPSHYEVAQNLYSDCFSGNCRNLGELHPETLKSKTSWARSIRLSDPKRHEESKKLWMEACAGFAKVFGLDGIPTVTSYREYEEFFAVNKRP